MVCSGPPTNRDMQVVHKPATNNHSAHYEVHEGTEVHRVYESRILHLTVLSCRTCKVQDDRPCRHIRHITNN